MSAVGHARCTPMSNPGRQWSRSAGPACTVLTRIGSQTVVSARRRVHTIRGLSESEVSTRGRPRRADPTAGREDEAPGEWSHYKKWDGCRRFFASMNRQRSRSQSGARGLANEARSRAARLAGTHPSRGPQPARANLAATPGQPAAAGHSRAPAAGVRRAVFHVKHRGNAPKAAIEGATGRDEPIGRKPHPQHAAARNPGAPDHAAAGTWNLASISRPWRGKPG